MFNKTKNNLLILIKLNKIVKYNFIMLYNNIYIQCYIIIK